MRRTAPLLAALCLLPGADGFRCPPATRTAAARPRPSRIRSSAAAAAGEPSDPGGPTASADGPSAASEWMENERRAEEEMDRADAGEKAAGADGGESSAATDGDTPREGSGRWEELHGNYILRPPESAGAPRALIHFLGGALLGAAPQSTYRYLLERLSSRGYLVVATPYQLSFDHLATCDEVIDAFERVAPSLARQYGAVPVVGVGHSCGALLHMLITSLFPDTPRAANALISYNNRGVGEAVPFFDELFVPLFGDESRNGSELIKSLIEVGRSKASGRVPDDGSLLRLARAVPTPLPELTGAILTPAVVSLPGPVRDALAGVAEPAYAALRSAGLASVLDETLDIADQVPKLIDEVEGGARDFTPTPDAMSSAARRAYRCRRTLLVQFENDSLDDSEVLEGYLREAESVMKTKRPMITIQLERKVLEGNHLTPLLGPSGGEGWGEALEGTLGSVLGAVDGIAPTGGGDDDGDDGPSSESVPGDEDPNARLVRERLGYQQVERVVEELATWLDEGSL